MPGGYQPLSPPALALTWHDVTRTGPHSVQAVLRLRNVGGTRAYSVRIRPELPAGTRMSITWRSPLTPWFVPGQDERAQVDLEWNDRPEGDLRFLVEYQLLCHVFLLVLRETGRN